jgi:hypothetical protein
MALCGKTTSNYVIHHCKGAVLQLAAKRIACNHATAQRLDILLFSANAILIF